MKKDGKYRFTLQFGSESNEQILAGELLERMGNKKSAVVVSALNLYVQNHPELNSPEVKLAVNQGIIQQRDKLEQLIRNVVENYLCHSGLQLPNTEPDTVASNLEDDITQMLDNLDMFNV